MNIGNTQEFGVRYGSGQRGDLVKRALGINTHRIGFIERLTRLRWYDKNPNRYRYLVTRRVTHSLSVTLIKSFFLLKNSLSYRTVKNCNSIKIL